MVDTERAQVDADRHEISELRKANEALQLQLKAASGRPRSQQTYAQLSPADRELVSKVRADEDQLQTRLASLESALANSPEKVLSTFVIKQQLDGLQDRNRADMESVHGEIGRLFTLTQWFIGLMFTVALGVFGLALTNLRRAEKTAADKGDAAG
jgi:chromosome segregation ATPase